MKGKLATSVFVLILTALILGGCRPGPGQPTPVPPAPTPTPLTPKPATPTPTPDEYEGWKTYTNELYGYSLRYPPDCTFGPMPGHCKEKPPEERPPECLCFLNAKDPDRVFLQAFTGEKEELKEASFAVDRLAFDPPQGTDLIQYVREKFPHYQDIPNEPNAKVGAIPAVGLYTPPSPQAFSMKEIYFIKDDKIFRISMLDVDEKANRELYDGISSALDISVETPSKGTESGITIVGTVMDTSLSALIVMLKEPVEGFGVIALTEESELTSTDGREITLRNIRPGMTIQASGQPGESNALLARQVLLLDATLAPPPD